LGVAIHVPKEAKTQDQKDKENEERARAFEAGRKAVAGKKSKRIEFDSTIWVGQYKEVYNLISLTYDYDSTFVQFDFKYKLATSNIENIDVKFNSEVTFTMK
jgi:hypothetical protein